MPAAPRIQKRLGAGRKPAWRAARARCSATFSICMHHGRTCGFFGSSFHQKCCTAPRLYAPSCLILRPVRSPLLLPRLILPLLSSYYHVGRDLLPNRARSARAYQLRLPHLRQMEPADVPMVSELSSDGEHRAQRLPARSSPPAAHNSSLERPLTGQSSRAMPHGAYFLTGTAALHGPQLMQWHPITTRVAPSCSLAWCTWASSRKTGHRCHKAL